MPSRMEGAECRHAAQAHCVRPADPAEEIVAAAIGNKTDLPAGLGRASTIRTMP
jgi:hypothetical protein